MNNDFAFINQLTESSEVIKSLSAISYQYNSRELIDHRHHVKLYHYQPKVEVPSAIPLLVVFATVNRPEILDLIPDHSFIGGLLKNGVDVYLLDWGYPEEDDNEISMSDYVTDYLDHCVKFISEKTNHKQINLLGICQGGILCLCYASLFHSIKNLILISTPIDFHTKDNVIAQVMKYMDVDELTKNNKNISGAWLTQFFISLRPFELIGKKYLRFVDHIADVEITARFLCVEKWLHDAPDQTGTSFRELVKDYYQENNLIKGKITLYGRKVDLIKLNIPILNIMARDDEIVPMSATRPLNKYINTKDYSELIFESGHIGIYISDKVGDRMPKAIAEWLKKRE